MVTQLLGAFVRASLVALMIAIPTIVIPGSGQDARISAMTFALIGAVITMIEYGSTHPGLVEFRFAPPFNRLRFGSMFLTVLAVSLMARGVTEPTWVTATVTNIGQAVGRAMDFPFSPVQIITGQITDGALPEQVALVRAAAGIAYVTSLVLLAVFAIAMRVLHWPIGQGTFNLWINLPTYDWSSGGDVEQRLIRDGRVNIIFGLTLPFLIPLVASSLKGLYALHAASNPHALVWTVAAWAFLPASLFMRGMAMHRIAILIRRKRDHLHQPSVADFAAA